MSYRNLKECITDLERTGQLVRIEQEIDPFLEAAEIQRRVNQAQGPAVFYERVKGCRFPMVSNLFGTLERTRFLFRDTLAAVRHLIELKIDPGEFFRHPWRYRDVMKPLWSMRPKYVSHGPVLQNETTIDQLPQLTSWPNDGGAFITLPEVYTEDPEKPGWRHSNLGMYRVQLSGGQYVPNEQVGLHYQIHRSIGVHHAAAIRRGEPLRVNIFVGGSPAMILAAVMPLPEGLSELTFAGALGGHRIRMIRTPSSELRIPVYSEADFCITGTVDPEKLLPEGPFGDHLGYYSLAHDFPVLNVEKVTHREGAVWPFTVVGRPPQEDTSFGKIIHELTGPVIPTVISGVHAVHAVDAAGVHPLLLAIGSERYVPYAEQRKPQELLTCAHGILGQGQLSLAKYLLIVAQEDDPNLDVENIPEFFRHLLERVDWQTDLHFQTCTTIDTLDYSGTGLNQGSKLVIAAAGAKRRELPGEIPSGFSLPDGFTNPRIIFPGVLVVQGPVFAKPQVALEGVDRFCQQFNSDHSINTFPLIVLVDDSRFTTESLKNFLWVTFTRSNPATDVHGVDSFTLQKHWGCRGSLLIDARIKPHHAPPLVEDPAVTKRVDQLASPGGPLQGTI
ncbi:MAG: UbiD family decarboxylase [Planctomycetes bacterium]|nr:UbiD family decarboxylase [Planctomycetota bacterium]